MNDDQIDKRQNLLIALYNQCYDVLRHVPREELSGLADELVSGFEAQQQSGEHPKETLMEYAVGCTLHRFKKPMAA